LPDVSALLLAAGLGTRLRPYTEHWPKCLMPINGRPLLEYWFSILHEANIKDVLVNLHYHAGIVREFLKRPYIDSGVNSIYENELLGTAGTLRKNAEHLNGKTTLLIHADNLCCCDFTKFLDFHHNDRPEGSLMTMMVFESLKPSACGIVELDANGIVQKFHEKVKNPPGNLANAAVYILEPEILEWILEHPEVSDFSTEVLPHLLGKIATWKNEGVLRDIGTIEMLRDAQNDKCKLPLWPEDTWHKNFMANPIHQQILINI